MPGSSAEGLGGGGMGWGGGRGIPYEFFIVYFHIRYRILDIYLHVLVDISFHSRRVAEHLFVLNMPVAKTMDVGKNRHDLCIDCGHLLSK